MGPQAPSVLTERQIVPGDAYVATVTTVTFVDGRAFDGPAVRIEDLSPCELAQLEAQTVADRETYEALVRQRLAAIAERRRVLALEMLPGLAAVA